MEIYCRMGHIVCDDWCQTEEESKERFQGILKANGLDGFVLPFAKHGSKTATCCSITVVASGRFWSIAKTFKF